ncbi:MAG: hypothetical protein PHR41_05195 [Lactococcus chungangensis]|jgi:hypothetical protein|uniref:Uncharacterized protein n=1 Tax=Pseudolactococcus chungangensis CAU 28 = DSM 22330 TaxID=1122154 RepID=A0A1K2H8Q0_9LACT|nr:hypothetical protein [Lactococcus chungangensis]MDD3015875.1 hypothetical protein [Lactococcus chungangensis]NCB82084.1 hypothetical protein [Bacilli bacterium]PCS03966.1 hypothetical protein RR45_GL001785 [Lactococcus chungangensis CAU 28 = DSM 22330]SFZ73168.1 hypothetical protein SAMN02746068_00773 [Lactococcus chungangensis CAU 28 = DSM 22330]
MDNNERWRLEEEYDEKMRLINQAEETIEDYRNQFHRKTSDLADYIHRFYHELESEYGRPNTQHFEENVAEFNWFLKQKQQELEETRDEARRDYYRKMEE